MFSSVFIRKCSSLLLFSKAPAYFLGGRIVSMRAGCLSRCEGRYQQVRYRRQIRNVHQDLWCKSSLSSVSLTPTCSASAIFSFRAVFGKPSIIHPSHKIRWIPIEMKGGWESSVIHKPSKVNKESTPHISSQVRKTQLQPIQMQSAEVLWCVSQYCAIVCSDKSTQSWN